jgi:glycosyltransferase involved in cell wall biosynthesis
LIERAKFRMNRLALHSARALVTWSEWARRSLIDDYGIPSDRVQVIAPGAGRQFFDIGRRRLAAEPGDTDRPVRVLFVGGDFRRKGGPMLLHCMRRSLAERCELHLVTNEPVLQGPNVFVYPGLGPNSPELLQLYEQADMLVLPSMAECLAVVLMEAAAAALPIIATDVGALAEVVHHNENGLLIRAGDARELERAIGALADDAPRRRGMAAAGHRLANAKFDSEANGLKIFDLVADLAADRPSVRSAA